jgi:hypothetical protein
MVIGGTASAVVEQGENLGAVAAMGMLIYLRARFEPCPA